MRNEHFAGRVAMTLRACLIVSAAMLLSGQVGAAEYKDGWNYENFYTAVEACRSAIIQGQAQAYENRGLSKGQSEYSMRSEVISMTPAFDRIGRVSCFCGMNEVAKTYSFQAYIAGADFRSVFNSSKCEKIINSELDKMMKDPAAEKLQ